MCWSLFQEAVSLFPMRLHHISHKLSQMCPRDISSFMCKCRLFTGGLSVLVYRIYSHIHQLSCNYIQLWFWFRIVDSRYTTGHAAQLALHLCILWWDFHQALCERINNNRSFLSFPRPTILISILNRVVSNVLKKNRICKFEQNRRGE